MLHRRHGGRRPLAPEGAGPPKAVTGWSCVSVGFRAGRGDHPLAMSDASAGHHGRDLGDTARDAAQEAANSGWVDRVARAGLVARAVIYLMVGYLAARVALSSAGSSRASTSRPASGEGVLETIAAHPGGRLVLGLLAAGFLGYAVLAAVQATFRHQQIRRDTERRAKRLFFAGVAVLYLAFCVYAVSLIVRPQPEQSSAAGAHRQETELTARVLGWPFGQLLVGTVGAVLVASGVGFGYQAVTTNFQERLKREQMRPAVWRAATVVGAVGSWARAIVLVLVGAFVGSAAISFNPRRARGLDASLRAVAHQRYGPYLLVAVAFGLACYGAYVLVEVRYRKV
jgi:hypothetical protein